jgi:TPR repeat protein
MHVTADKNMESWMNELAAAAANGQVDFYNRIADQLATPVDRFEWARYAALLGVRDAVHSVVDAYQKGDGVEPSESAAFEWIRKAAKDGDGEFYFDLAMAYRDGAGTERNVAAFWDWMAKSASRSVSTSTAASRREAMFQLAEAHLKPEFGQFSVEKSVEWTRKMVDAGAAGAMVRLARQYRDGDDYDKVLEWSQRAVEAASTQWLAARVNSNGSYHEELTIEDRPEALAMLAEAYRIRGQHSEASKASREAAKAAAEAIQLAREYGMECGKKLPEIMLEKLADFKNKHGNVKPNRQVHYLEWLLKIDAAIDEAFLADDHVPKVLVDVLYRIALAYKEGIGTPKNRSKYQKYLKKSAEAGHGEAAYEYAVKCHHEGDQLGFSQSVEMAAAENNMKGLIARALGNCDLPERDFRSTLTLLQSLWQAVDTIRKTKHVLNQEDCMDGLAHYTDAVALTSMLAGNRDEKRNFIRLYSTAYMNDPKEGTRLQTFSKSMPDHPLQDFLPAEIGAYLPISWESKEFHVFIGCFSRQCDNLDLWRFYGRDGKGFGVVTPFSAFGDSSAAGMLRGPWTKDAAGTSRLTLYRVLYEDKEAATALDALREPLKRLRLQMDRLAKRGVDIKDEIRRIAALIVSELLYLYKDKNYANECEVRAIEARALGDPNLQLHAIDGGFSKLFVETPAFLFHEQGSKIIVGPKVENSLVAMIDIRHKLARHNWNACTVINSAMAYR